MITLLILLSLICTLLLYASDSNSTLLGDINDKLETYKTLSKVMGLVLLVLTVYLAVIDFGYISGVLAWIFMISTFLSLIIILYPLKQIKVIHLGGLFGLIFTIEMMVK